MPENVPGRDPDLARKPLWPMNRRGWEIVRWAEK